MEGGGLQALSAILSYTNSILEVSWSVILEQNGGQKSAPVDKGRVTGAGFQPS